MAKRGGLECNALNTTIGGRLLKPANTAAICHSNQPTYHLELCKTTLWTNASTYADHPLGIMNPNWSEDSCLPGPQYPCSSAGFPLYVINATCSGDVAKGVSFAREHNVRLNVKGSGHDYLGRSTAPNSLSIWTKHVRSIEFHDAFQRKQCSACDVLPAVTLGAGEDWDEIYAAANQRNRTLVGRTGDTIGLGGYLTGGGHSHLSAMYGLAADQVLKMDMVLADGEMVTANEAKNMELFWAMRGESGIMGYSYVAPAYPYNGTLVGGYIGGLPIPNGTVERLKEAVAFLEDYITTIPDVRTLFVPVQYLGLYAWYLVDKNVGPIGKSNAIGNRLLDRKALSNFTALRAAMKKATPSGSISNLTLVARSRL
ncbi:hypothetical protein LTR37_019239 [Vermiconidia calcicola]|uniref:Uncharacterized protein n=1 Tax=Vermiconidia calcicola TaxID=1690605 RepID=A0ACC3MEM2_9PEZI|nr:hypothetical protein LTR37_019239 [Vermiconidia calcicola]